VSIFLGCPGLSLWGECRCQLQAAFCWPVGFVHLCAYSKDTHCLTANAWWIRCSVLITFPCVLALAAVTKILQTRCFKQQKCIAHPPGGWVVRSKVLEIIPWCRSASGVHTPPSL
jgi:hypothetical protein